MFLIQEFGPRGLEGMAEPLQANDIAGAVNIAIREADDRTAVEFNEDNTAIIDTPAGYRFFIYPLDWEEEYRVIPKKLRL